MKNLLLASVLFLLFQGCTKKGEDRVFILPNNFIGYAIIIYNQSDGNDVKYTDDKRLYVIPHSGVLKTKFTADYGWRSISKFYYGSINDRNRIPLVVDPSNYSEKDINASSPHIGKIYPNENKKEPIEYSIFYIGTNEQIKKATREVKSVDILKLIK